MKFKHTTTGEVVDAFRWTIDVVPDWWKNLEGVQVQTSTTTAILPTGETAEIGNYIFQNSDGLIIVYPAGMFEANYRPVNEQPVTLRGPGEGKSFKQRFWSEWIGKQIVLQCKGRAIIIGTLRSFENGFLRIEDAEIKGIKNLAKVRTLMVDRDHVGHFHEPGEVEKLEFSRRTLLDEKVFESPLVSAGSLNKSVDQVLEENFTE